MAEPVDIRGHVRTQSPQRTARIAEAIEICREVSERARAMRLGLVAYPVSDVELLLEALTGHPTPKDPQ